jgi:hypothetical protein
MFRRAPKAEVQETWWQRHVSEKPKRGGKPVLCQFARQFPPLVADFLDCGRQFKRRLREETVTDLMMVYLQSLGSDQIIVDFPDEPTTGADMQWNFVNRGNDTFYCLLLQAKCAYGNDALLSRHTYKYLSHCTAGRYQADILCEASRNAGFPTYPLYIFYNPAHTCLAARDVEGTTIEGVNLANGYSIRSFARKRRTHISGIRPYMHSLTRLFCPPDDQARIPRPADVRDYLIHRGSMSFGLPEDILRALDADDHIMIPPEVGTAIPEGVQARIERTGAPVEGTLLRRRRVTFISDAAAEE